MKKTISLILAALFGVCLIMPAAMAATIAPGEQRITMGADLSDAQCASIYEFFGVERGTNGLEVFQQYRNKLGRALIS